MKTSTGPAQNSITCWGSLIIAAANPVNAYAPDKSQRLMRALFRFDDVHQAATAAIAAHVNETKLINGSSSGGRANTKSTMGAATAANKKLVDRTCSHSV